MPRCLCCCSQTSFAPCTQPPFLHSASGHLHNLRNLLGTFMSQAAAVPPAMHEEPAATRPPSSSVIACLSKRLTCAIEQVALGSCPQPDAATGLGDCTLLVPPSAFPANASDSLAATLRLAAQQGGQDLAAAVSGNVGLTTPPPDSSLPGIGMVLQLPYRSLHPGMPDACTAGCDTSEARAAHDASPARRNGGCHGRS